jgi:hypothetical protein
MEGGVGSLVQVPFQFRGYPPQSGKSAKRFTSFDPQAFQRRLSSAPTNFPYSKASHPPYERVLYSHHTLAFSSGKYRRASKALLVHEWPIPKVRKTSCVAHPLGAWFSKACGFAAYFFLTRTDATPALPIASPAQENRTARNPARNASDTAFLANALPSPSRLFGNSIPAS